MVIKINCLKEQVNVDSKCKCGVVAIVKEKEELYCATCWIRKRFNFFKKEVKKK
jgi:hypothetical protein